MAFEVETFDLSLRNPTTGAPLTANVYRVEGIDRPLSMGGLLMAICLRSATDLERQIIEKMEANAATTVALERMTALQTALVAWQTEVQGKKETGTARLRADVEQLKAYAPDLDLDGYTDWVAYLADESSLGLKLTYPTPEPGGYTYDQITAMVGDVSNGMDSFNTISQTEMIDLQALTNRRDERYNLISNGLKSFYTVLGGNANNL